jgi:hypothetical protein
MMIVSRAEDTRGTADVLLKYAMSARDQQSSGIPFVVYAKHPDGKVHTETLRFQLVLLRGSTVVSLSITQVCNCEQRQQAESG